MVAKSKGELEVETYDNDEYKSRKMIKSDLWDFYR